MLRRIAILSGALALTVLAPAAAPATIWPDQLADFKKVSSKPVTVSDRPLWDEYGLAQSEQAAYESATAKFTATAWRLKDSTGALAVFEWRRPADARAGQAATELAAETKDGALVAFGNYVFEFSGWKPTAAELNYFFNHLPQLDQSPLPKVHLPAAGMVANSERYILGPVGLDKFLPGIPPSVAAFSMGAEVELGTYGPMQMAVFSYPTPQIARQRVEEFQKLAGTMAKRSGPLVAIIRSPKDADAAERLLATVQYRAEITENERVITQRDNPGDLIVNIFVLIGILVCGFVVAGLGFGVMRRIIRRGKPEEGMIVLNLQDR